MSVRKELETALTAAFPDIKVIATEKALGDITKPTLLIRGRSVTLTDGAPLSHRDVGLLLTLISPHLDLDRAADQLDDLVIQVLDWLDPRYSHEPAAMVGWTTTRLAYDIPTTIIASKEN